MTTLAPGQAPATDQQWSRSVEERLRGLANPRTVRIGSWVLQDAAGVLTATRPGDVANAITGLAEPVTFDFGDLSGYVSEKDFADALSRITGTVIAPGDLSGIMAINEWAAGISSTINGWLSAFIKIGIESPLQFIGLLRGLIPPSLPALDGTFLPTAINGFIDNLNGTWNFVQDQAEAAISTLVQQANGTIVSAASIVQNTAQAAQAVGSSAVAVMSAAGQQVADAGIAALNGLAAQFGAVGHTAEQFGNQLGGAITSWYNSWSGNSVANAAAAQLAAQAKAAADAQAAAAALTNEISTQLPKFYGASGSGGLSASQSFIGLTALPAGWTAVSTPLAGAAARYDTPADTNSQTVSGIWSSTDPLAKYLILRASLDFNYLVYAKVQSDDPVTGAGKCEIGYVLGGVKTVLGSPFTLPGATQQANQSYDFSATDWTFTLTGPSGLSHSEIDGSMSSQRGPLFVYGGFATDGTAKTAQNLTTLGNITVPAGFVTGDKFIAVGFGGGGGGGGSIGATSGTGGITGGNFQQVLTYGVDVPLTTTAFSFVPGVGGAGGAASIAGSPGGSSTLTITGYGVLTALGGVGGPAGGNNPFNPASVAQFAFNNYGYFNVPGSAPGGGGIGGFLGGAGAAAGGGGVNVVPVSMQLPGNMLNWVFYDSGPTSGPASGYVPATLGELSTSTAYTDLATVGPSVTVNIGTSGLAIVMISCQSYTNAVNSRAMMSFELSGANTRAGAIENTIGIAQAASTSSESISGCFLLTGLLPGSTTFRAKYRVDSGTGTWHYRTISVIPL